MWLTEVLHCPQGRNRAPARGAALVKVLGVHLLSGAPSLRRKEESFWEAVQFIDNSSGLGSG